MICRNCKFDHSPLMQCSQAARLRVSKAEVVTPDPAPVEQVVKRASVQAEVSQAPVLVDAHAKQRWSREAYNAYQREYMRRRRAKP